MISESPAKPLEEKRVASSFIGRLEGLPFESVMKPRLYHPNFQRAYVDDTSFLIGDNGELIPVQRKMLHKILKKRFF